MGRVCRAVGAATVALLAGTAYAATPTSIYDYEYDGATTYCYWIQQGMQVSNYDFAYVLAQGVGDECPLTIALQQTTTGTVFPGQVIEYAFTATLNLNDNAFDMTSLQSTVPDPVTGLPEQIGHANVHTCSRSTVCDVFRTGSNRKISDQETSNFTGDSASFRQKITFDVSGEKNVFAHIILPPVDYLEESYHFITFITTEISSVSAGGGGGAAGAGSADSSSGVSTGLVVGLVVGGVVVILAVIVAIVFWRRKSRPEYETDHFRNSGFNPNSHASKMTRLDWSAEPAEYAWKDNYNPTETIGRGDDPPPALSASALMFNDSAHRPQKTVSSSGSIRYESPGADAFNGYGSPSGTVSTIKVPPRGGNQFRASQSAGLDRSQSSVFNDGSQVYNEDGMLEYGRTPDMEGFHINPHSLESEVSVGTSYDYNGATHLNNATFNPLLSGYTGRESDLSSVDDYMYDERGLPATDGYKQQPMDMRISEASIGTVDFTGERSQQPYGNRFNRLDESTASSTDFASTLASSAARSTGVYDVDAHGADSFATTASSSVTSIKHNAGAKPRQTRTMSDGESYEF